MSEDVGQGYPSAQGAPTMAPPPPPPTGAVGPGPASPSPKKKPVALIVAAVLAVMLCGLGGCVAALLAFSGAGDTEKISVAETHFSAMMSAVESATAALEGIDLEGGDSEEARTGLAEATAALRSGRDEIAAARASIEQLDDSQGKTDYLASLDSATETLDGLENLMAYVGTSIGMLDKMTQAAEKARDANDLLNDAISAGNGGKYAKMQDKAKSASARYKQAAALFREAHGIDESAGLDQSAKFAEKRNEVALVVIQMSRDGKAGRTAAYNKGISKMKKLNAAAEKIGEPDIVSDEDWLVSRLSEFETSITAAGEKADELHARAVEALGYGD